MVFGRAFQYPVPYKSRLSRVASGKYCLVFQPLLVALSLGTGCGSVVSGTQVSNPGTADGSTLVAPPPSWSFPHLAISHDCQPADRGRYLGLTAILCNLKSAVNQRLGCAPPTRSKTKKWWTFGRYADMDRKIRQSYWTSDFFVVYGDASPEFDIENLAGFGTLPNGREKTGALNRSAMMLS